jgi:[CysO sulfur-carrier protein]-S-L-cysteine hydrolase
VALREGQLQRYSRHVLLRGVGGRGQEALLGTGARLGAAGPAFLAAAAYLGAGGNPVLGPEGALGPGDTGFLVRASELGVPAAAVLRLALEALNPDAVASPVRTGALVALPDSCLWPRPLVAVGQRDGRWVLWAATEEACAACLLDVVAGVSAPEDGPEAIQAGALVALLYQRLVLGLGSPLSGMGLGRDGRMEVLEAPACPHGANVPDDVLAAAVRHLEACYPEEGCGVLLSGQAGMRWVALRNAYDSWAARDPLGFPRTARTAFLFEPSEWLALLREADAAGERVACIVHAHPDGQPAFSADDAAQAAPSGLQLLPGVDYLVVAIVQGEAKQAVRVRWREGRFHEWPFFLPK